jgi:asparagine synthase (glutamine-hydrolysing)
VCGIGGVFSWSDAGAFDAPRTAADLCAALAHRGPDGEGGVSDRGLLLVHRRLAIIDLTPGGHQPMTTPDGRFSLVYNGEIYNYRDLRSELEQSGVHVRSSSDTEVLLALIVRNGIEALRRARGMFALALWDRTTRSLTLARDRFGMKPLYVAATADRVAFASEIGALRRAGLAERDVSHAGVLAFLAWSHIPSPLTWLRSVESLPPGMWKRWHADGRTVTGTFADAADVYEDRTPIAEEELLAQARQAMKDSVAAHMVSDVPVGVFLSGGLDSAALVANARSVAEGALHTYTVGTDVPSMSEIGEARETATSFQTTHHELMIGAGAIERALPAVIRHLDAPSADAVNSYFVSQAVAATRIKTVLSGVGGDEMFGGYPSFQRVPSAMRTAKWLAPMLPVTAMAAAAVPDWRARKLQHFAGTPDAISAYRAVRGTFMPEEWPHLLGPAFDGDAGRAARELLAEIDAQRFRSAPSETPLAAVARMETVAYLRGQLLRDIDAVSMAHGLEVRMPFVDHHLAAAIWPSLGHHPALLSGKRLLQLSAPPLPAALATRPKRGFTLPFDTWMRSGLREMTLRGIESAVSLGWINACAAAALWAEWERGRAHWSRPWALSVLGQFLQDAA